MYYSAADLFHRIFFPYLSCILFLFFPGEHNMKHQRHGHGKYIWNRGFHSGDVYDGEYKNNKKEGFGVMKYANGTVYEGQFKNNERHGHGMYDAL